MLNTCTWVSKSCKAKLASLQTPRCRRSGASFTEESAYVNVERVVPGAVEARLLAFAGSICPLLRVFLGVAVSTEPGLWYIQLPLEDIRKVFHGPFTLTKHTDGNRRSRLSQIDDFLQALVYPRIGRIYRFVQVKDLEQLRRFTTAIRTQQQCARAIGAFHLCDADRTRKGSIVRHPHVSLFIDLRSVRLVDLQNSEDCASLQLFCIHHNQIRVQRCDFRLNRQFGTLHQTFFRPESSLA